MKAYITDNHKKGELKELVGKKPAKKLRKWVSNKKKKMRREKRKADKESLKEEWSHVLY